MSAKSLQEMFTFASSICPWKGRSEGAKYNLVLTTYLCLCWGVWMYSLCLSAHGHHTKWVHIFSQFCPSLLAAAPLSVQKVTSRGERSGVGRRRGCKGHKEQDTGSGERWRVGRQCDAQGCWTGGEEKEEKQAEEKEEGEHRVCASGTGRQGKIAWARLAGRVCLCLIEEGCETETPHWLSFTGMLPWRDGHWLTCFRRKHTHTHTQPHAHTFVQWEQNKDTGVTGEYGMRESKAKEFWGASFLKNPSSWFPWAQSLGNLCSKSLQKFILLALYWEIYFP